MKITWLHDRQLTVSPYCHLCADGEPSRFEEWDSPRARRTWRSHHERSHLSSPMQRPSQRWLACGRRSLPRQKRRFMFRRGKDKCDLCPFSHAVLTGREKFAMTKRCTWLTLLIKSVIFLFAVRAWAHASNAGTGHRSAPLTSTFRNLIRFLMHTEEEDAQPCWHDKIHRTKAF